MIKKCAVIIGVNKTGELPFLSAAVQGAKDFDTWARQQGFVTTLLTDEGGAVDIASVKQAVRQYVDAKKYSQLLVFFAGHGVLRGPNDELWLLSGSPEDAMEAVNVTTSRSLAIKTGIPHIVFISDACRSAPSNALITQVIGAPVFPNVRPAEKQPDVDMFYATRPGDFSFEVKDSDEAVDGYKGLFTHYILQGLTGKVPEVITLSGSGSDTSAVVYPYELKQYLDKTIPVEIEKIDIRRKQYPGIEVTSRPPLYLSVINPDDPSVTQKINTEKESGGSQQEQLPHKEPGNNFGFTDKHLVIRAQEESWEIEKEVALQRVAAAGSSNIKTGFTIIGTNEFDILLSQGEFSVNRQQDFSNIIIHPQPAGLPRTYTMIFITADGTGVPVAVLPDFTGNIIVEDNRVVNINYVPGTFSDKYDNFMVNDDEVAKRRTRAMKEVRSGRFRVAADGMELMMIASYLRNYKAFDPTLGLYASYAYEQAGNRDGVKSVFEYMKEEPEPVLYDVKLLASLSDFTVPGEKVEYAPFCPMLNQGWSYLQLSEKYNSPFLKELCRHLVPGLWTTFTPTGVSIIQETFKNQ